ncbi:MAG: AMP-binding protein, partial [Phenylobacterium sp.]|nr:AMP-binding protein [Phenylobacterium sp.]
FLRQLLGELPPGFPVQGGMRIVSTGGVLSPAVAREARLRLAPEILISYGAAETGSTTMADGAWLETHPGAAGYPVPNVRVEVVGDDGAPLPPGEQGEIRIFSDRRSEGYLGNPEATARAFRDGGFYPGDLGRLRPDGMLIVEGRVDDRMDLGGMKFLPELMEEAALGYPGVKDAAAYAAPDATGTDVCWLAVVAAPDLDRQGLARHIATSGPNLPEARFAWIEAIPRNAMGKTERRRLREETIAVLTSR